MANRWPICRRRASSDARSLRDAKRVLRAAIDVCLDGRSLKSREVMLALRQREPLAPTERPMSDTALHGSIALGREHRSRGDPASGAPRPLSRSPVCGLLAEEAGADSITLHLREDRRHIQDRDVTAMREALQTRMNLEMAVTEEMVRIAQNVKPQDCLPGAGIAPGSHHRGRLECRWARARAWRMPWRRWARAGIRVSLFIDPDRGANRGRAARRAPR